MRRTAILFAIIVMLVSIPVVGSSRGQGPSPAQVTIDPKAPTEAGPEDLRKRVEVFVHEQMEAAQPDTSSENWKQLTNDLGILMHKDGHGVIRGTLYVLRDEKWHPVAIEGLAELGPHVIPAGR